MYYGYAIGSKWGMVPAFDNELNLPAALPPKSLVSLHQPSSELQASGRAILIYPVSSSPTIMAYDGKTVYTEEMQAMEGRLLGMTRTGTPIILGPVVDYKTLSKPGNVRPIAIDVPGHSFVILGCIIGVIIALIIFATVANITWAQVETAKYEAHKYDVIAESQEVVQEWTTDLNGDGIPDIHHIIWGNGEYIQAAISDYGVQALGGTAQTIKEGDDWNDLVEDLERDKAEEDKWKSIGTIVTVAVIGGCAFLILRYGLPAVLPPRVGRPAPYLPYERAYPAPPATYAVAQPA